MKHTLMICGVLILVLAMVMPLPAETFNLATGYNFFSPTAATSVSSQDVLENNAATKSVFRFDPANQSFQFHLRLSGGNLFGTTFTLQDGEGVMVEAESALSLEIAGNGGAAAADPFTAMYAGFNFIGLPGRSTSKASDLLAAETGLQSVFRWNSANAAFDFLIKLPTGTSFGTDFAIADGVGYFLNHATGNRVDPSKTLTGITLSSSTQDIATSAALDLSTITVTAVWSDSTTSNVTGSTNWSIVSGEGTLNGTSWTAPATAGSATLRASFTNGTVTETADLTVTVTAKTLSSIALDVTAATGLPSETADLSQLTVTATYSDNSTSNVSLSATWSLVSGGGTLNGSVWTAPATPTTAVLRATYSEGGVTQTADITLTVPTLAMSITLAKTTHSMATGSTVDLATLTTVTANNNDSTTSDVTSSATWSIQSGGGTLNGSNWTAPGTTGTAVLRATYTIDQYQVSRTAELTITVTQVMKTVQSVALSASSTAVKTTATLDLSTITTTATYADSSTADVSSSVAWSIQSGEGSVNGSTFTPTSTSGTSVLRASYTDPSNATAHTADLTVWTVTRLITRLELENPPPSTIKAGASVVLKPSSYYWLYYDNGSSSGTSSATGITWSIISGGGTLIGNNWTAPGSSGTATIRCTYTGEGQIVSTDLTFTIVEVTPATVSVAASATNPTVTLTSLTSTETAVAIVYTRNNVENATFNYTLQGGAAGAPGRSLTRMLAPQPGDSLHPHYRTTLDQERMARLLEATPGTAGPFPAPDPNRAPARAPVVDSTLNFWVSNASNTPVEITATCRAVSNHAYFFEDNNIKGSYTQIPASSWTAMATAWDSNIYPTLTGTFGHEPRPTDPSGDVDQDEKIYILFSSQVNEAGKAGYFDSTHEYTAAQISTFGSAWAGVQTNAKEMFFMWVPTDQDPTWWVNSTMGTLAHEFQHMISYTQHYRALYPNGAHEESWLNEGLSQVAEDIAGYGYAKGSLNFVIEPFLAAPQNYSLTHWSFNNGSYGCSYMFVRYLVDQGISVSTLLQSGKTGIANVEAALNVNSWSRFEDVYKDWVTCLYLSNTGYSPESRYNYSTINSQIPQPNYSLIVGPNMTSTQTSTAFGPLAGTLKSWGMSYIKITGATGADATFTATDPGGSSLGMIVIRHGQ